MATSSPSPAASAPSSEEASSSSTTTTKDGTGTMRFGKFLIPQSHIFCQSPLSVAFVNIRPIVPGHVLVMPERTVPLMEDLTEDEYNDMWLLVRRVQGVLKTHHVGTTAFNVAVQDGGAAGQSVPHVHVHVLPRRGGDLRRNDDVYEELEMWAPRAAADTEKERTGIDVPDDKDRVDRTDEMMAEEAAAYRRIWDDTPSKR